MPSVSRKCGIYKIVCKSNGRAYYGSTNNWTVRKAGHRYLLRRGRHHSRHLQNCWNKYGEADIEFVWIEYVAEALLHIIEQEYIDRDNHSMNMAKDAERPMLGRKHTEEWKRNHAVKVTGKRHTEQFKRDISERNRGRKLSDDCKQKISQAVIKSGRMLGEKNYFYGKPRPREEILARKRKLQLAGKGYCWHKCKQRWRVSWTCQDGKRREWKFKTEQEAIGKVAELKRQLKESVNE
jgi:group I intron endonuclease